MYGYWRDMYGYWRDMYGYWRDGPGAGTMYRSTMTPSLGTPLHVVMSSTVPSMPYQPCYSSPRAGSHA